jgi:hypothetical protein
LQRLVPEGFVGAKTGMLASQPIAKISQEKAPSRNRKKQPLIASAPSVWQEFLE